MYRTKIAAVLFVFVTILMMAGGAHAEGFERARITNIINDVFVIDDITKDNPALDPAVENEILQSKHAVRTAQKSGAGLTFNDGSVVRVGEDAFFSFSTNERNVQMGKGSALFQVPKGSAETNVQTATITAALTGTTIMINQKPNDYVKTIVVEGQVNLSMPERAGESRTLTPGEMVIMPTDARRIPDPVNVDLKTLTETSGLINNDGNEGESDEGGKQADDGLDQDQIAEGVQQQQQQIEDGELEATNMVIEEGGRDVTVEADADGADPADNISNKDAVEQQNQQNRAPAFRIGRENSAFFGTPSQTPDLAGRPGTIIDHQENDPGAPGEFNEDVFLRTMACDQSCDNDRTARFDEPAITLANFPSMRPTDSVQNVAFRSERLFFSGGIDRMFNSQFDSLSLIEASSKNNFTLPDLTISNGPDRLGVYRDNGTLTAQDISVPMSQDNLEQDGGSLFLFAQDGLIVEPGSTLQGVGLALTGAEGGVTINESSQLESDFFTSVKTRTGTIEIENSSQLRTLTSIGTVRLKSDGGDINVQGQVGYFGNTENNNAKIVIDTTDDQSQGLVTINGELTDPGGALSKEATLKASVIKARAHGPNGALRIGNSLLKPSSTLKLFAPEQGGVVHFTDDTRITRAKRLLKAPTIKVSPGVQVAVNNTSSDYPLELHVKPGQKKFQNLNGASFDPGADYGAFVEDFGGRRLNGEESGVRVIPFGDSQATFDDSTNDS